MKIKIIDLLVKMANGEKLPKKIKYRDNIWEYISTIMGTGYQYYSECYQEWKTLQNQVYLEECLNDEVEIIEEPKKIEKLKAKYTSQVGKLELANKINELIDEINNLKEND